MLREADTSGPPRSRGRCGLRRGQRLCGALRSQAQPRAAHRGPRPSDESATKLEIAGADRIISSYAVGGRRLASLATQPLVVDSLKVMTRGEVGIEFRLEEFVVPKTSAIVGRTIGEPKIGEKTAAIVLVFRTAEGKFDTTPSADNRLHAGDTLIVLSSRDQTTRLEQSSYAGRKPPRSKHPWLPTVTTPMAPWDGRSPCRRDRCSCARSGPLSPSASRGSTDRVLSPWRRGASTS